MLDLNVNGLIAALSDQRLLSPEHFKVFIEGILPICQEPRILAAELVYRSWLTPYQLSRISDGKYRKLIFGSYTILEPIGQGSMGKVYMAKNWKTGQVVALKLIRDEHSQNVLAIRRFQREIRALSKVNHPNIVSVFDADAHGEAIFYIMEYVPGIDLGRLLNKQGPLPVPRAVEFARQTALALENLHQSGLIHRDVKPSNLLLEKKESLIKLLDLGLARFIPGQQQYSGDLTRLGILIGTPDYISPEQIQDPRSATIRSDLYSLGCTLYHLLAGKAPFEEVSIVDKLYHQCHHQPRPIETLRGDLPKPLVKIVRTLLEKKPRRRYRRPQDLADALAEVMKLLKPYDSDYDIDLQPQFVQQFGQFEEKLLPATEEVKLLPLVRKRSDYLLSPSSNGLVPPTINKRLSGSEWTSNSYR